MLLEEIEIAHGFRYPVLFRNIYEKGVMQWMTSRKWLEENRSFLADTPGAFFYNMNADCEPIIFENIGERLDFINEMNALSGYKLKNGMLFLPFAQTARGDLFCFVYENKKHLNHIIQYCHDCDTIINYGDDFEDFFFFFLWSAIANWDEELDSPPMLAHIGHLGPRYRDLFKDPITPHLV